MPITWSLLTKKLVESLMSKSMKNAMLVSINELTPQMKIISYCGFGSIYKFMDEKTSKWIKVNFKGSTAEIIRNETQFKVGVEELLEGDSLICLFDLPSSLRKLTQVNKRLIQELQKRQFLKFTVHNLTKATGDASGKRSSQEVKNAVNGFISQVKESVAVRKKGTKSIENLLDNARQGDNSTDELVKYIEVITGNSTFEAMSAIVSLQESDQTYAHCVDVGTIFLSSYLKILKKKGKTSIFRSEPEILLGAFLHDFGKSKVPKEVLDSSVRFARDSKEMQLMTSHPTFGMELLTQMGLPDYIINMAHYHHVKMDTEMKSSYPPIKNYDEVIYETRLLALIDIYQALVGKRSYKKSWAPPSAVRYIESLAGVEYDYDVWEDFLFAIGKYPVGSLVQLSTNDIAFVVEVPDDTPDSPTVVTVRDADGKDIKDHTFIELSHNKNITISKDLDVSEIFGEKGLEVFTRINLR